jgi:membrane protease YdiL (CAAX protease family)
MAVFLSGAWMSIVAWRTGSIWLSVGCHMFLNASAIALSRSIDDFFSGIGLAVLLGCLVTGVLAMIASCLLFSRIEPGPRRVLPRRPVLMPADRPPLSG